MKSIIFNNVNFSYPDQDSIFDGLSCQIENLGREGHVTAIMGTSGAGKTTLLKLMLGVIKPHTGSVKFLPEESIVAYVPQEPVLFEHLSPMVNAEYFKHASKLKQRFDQKLFDHLVDILELRLILEKRRNVSELSGGQKQRLSLLRALSIRPDFLLLDEPCTGLDAEVKFAFLAKLHELISELDLSVVYVTHHIEEGKFIADEIAYLVQDGVTKKVIDINQQPVTDFLKTPPSLDALRLVHFPEINFAGIQTRKGPATFSDNPDCFITIENENIKIVDPGGGMEFSKLFSTGVYSCYKHANSSVLLTLKTDELDLEDNLFVNLSGSFNSYSTKGVFDKILNLDISDL